VLDNDKHYWVGEDEIEKLLKRGDGWLGQHPEKELIVSRYLKRQHSLTRAALERLDEDAPPEDEAKATAGDAEEEKVERPLGLHEQRIGTVLSILRGIGAKRVLDLGCGEGKLLRHLVADGQFERVLGMDVSWRSIEIAKDKLKLDQMGEKQRSRIELIQGSLMYRDRRLEGFDAAAVVEVIEHLDAPRLASFERVLFEFANPEHVIVTTPNAEYNRLFPMPENLERLRARGLSAKRSLASREFALGIEALDRFVRKEPLRRTHECVFGVLALESEPVDPRL
jgi:3' terminal RNA ribose 2'-O-methyltransferase Hen1